MKDISAIFKPMGVIVRECEAPRCTSHDKPIAEVVEIIGSLDGKPHEVGEWFRPLIVHCEPDPFYGVAYSVCSAGAPR